MDNNFYIFFLRKLIVFVGFHRSGQISCWFRSFNYFVISSTQAV